MYMVQQRVTTAIREGYRGADGVVVAGQRAEARRTLAWLEGLDIDPDVRATLIEPIAAIDEALAEIERASAAPGARRGSDS